MQELQTRPLRSTHPPKCLQAFLQLMNFVAQLAGWLHHTDVWERGAKDAADLLLQVGIALRLVEGIEIETADTQANHRNPQDPQGDQMPPQLLQILMQGKALPSQVHATGTAVQAPQRRAKGHRIANEFRRGET